MPLGKVLLTGFEPFAGETVNPSEQAVRALDGRTIGGHRIVAAVLPVRFDTAIAHLRGHLREVRPHLVIGVGEAGGSRAIAVERIAINVDDARIADNAGARPIDRAIAARGPAAYWSTLPVKAIAAALAKHRVPAIVSGSAGTFVCNHVFYGLMHALARRPSVRGGLIHVPYLPAQVRRRRGTPSMALPRIVAALEIAIATALSARARPRRPRRR
ncbi:MAG TPA: pyroglutamyl-peptidase I [Kofleriaceae bacterium]|nr:pyroglutamyl-peptidase I [Kofleriaceae bacterium]